MNYRHIFHAGNFADVIKHVALISVLLHLRRKEKPFCVVDTHAGSGLYEMEGSQAIRTWEWKGGIARVRDLNALPNLPEALRKYLDLVNAEDPGRYPGSPRLAARLLRPQDRLIAIERNPEDAAALAQTLGGFPQARAIADDAYTRLPGLLPPRERRGIVLIDPPYEAEDEFIQAARLLTGAHHRFSTGIYLLWFPVKSSAAAEAFCGELRTEGIAPAVRLDIDLGGDNDTQPRRLSRAGLVVVNPPYTFEPEMRSAGEFLTPVLGHAPERPSTLTLTTI
jgi:23S rRNA (adenine2030-N6)-methyltransferase